MENTKRCLNFHNLMPVDQGFRHHYPNLCPLKAVAVREVMHLTMVHVLDTFGNIFKGDTLHKKHLPNGLDGIQMSKGGATHAIVCCFCPYSCSNDDYTYQHLLATQPYHPVGLWDMLWVHEWVLIQNQGACTGSSEEDLQGVIPLML